MPLFVKQGNAYACLEALATDLPIVTTRAGLFEDIPAAADGRTEVGYTLPVTATPEAIARSVKRCVERMNAGELQGKPRGWAEKNANMTHFAETWDTFLRGLL